MGAILRLLVIAAIIWFVWQSLRRFLGQNSQTPNNTVPPDNTRGGNQLMHPCAWCKVHIPEGESTQSRGHYFCCEAHRDAFLQKSQSR